MVKRAGSRRSPAGWWALGGEWLAASFGLEHGRRSQALATFAADRDLKPITVRKAASTRAFVEALVKTAVPDAERFATLPLERLEALQRVTRFGPAHVRSFALLLAEGLRGKELEKEERRIRLSAEVCGAENEHVYRLRARSFLQRVIDSLPAAFPSPSRLAPDARAAAACVELTYDAVVRRGANYVGVKVVPVPGEAGRADRRREYVKLGLANSRCFEEYWFICERRDEADLIGVLFAELRCGVGVALLDGDGPWTIVTPAERDRPADLGPRFSWKLGELFG